MRLNSTFARWLALTASSPVSWSPSAPATRPAPRRGFDRRPSAAARPSGSRSSSRSSSTAAWSSTVSATVVHAWARAVPAPPSRRRGTRPSRPYFASACTGAPRRKAPSLGSSSRTGSGCPIDQLTATRSASDGSGRSEMAALRVWIATGPSAAARGACRRPRDSCSGRSSWLTPGGTTGASHRGSGCPRGAVELLDRASGPAQSGRRRTALQRNRSPRPCSISSNRTAVPSTDLYRFRVTPSRPRVLATAPTAWSGAARVARIVRAPPSAGSRGSCPPSGTGRGRCRRAATSGEGAVRADEEPQVAIAHDAHQERRQMSTLPTRTQRSPSISANRRARPWDYGRSGRKGPRASDTGGRCMEGHGSDSL